MDYNNNLSEVGELYHHGIKGQKWGVRRFQRKDGTWTKAGKERYGDDIPDDKSESSSGEGKKTSRGLAIAKTAARAAASALKNPTSKHENKGGVDSLSDKLRPRSTKDKNDGGVDSLPDKLKPSTKSAKSAKSAKGDNTKNAEDSDTTNANTNDGKRFELTDKQKKALKIGAAVAGSALAAYGVYKVSQMYKGAGSKIDPDTGFRLINKDVSDADNLLAVNPGRVRFLSKTKNMEIIHGSSTNCMLCTTAYEFRKRGFDVHAGLEKSGMGYMPDDLFPKLFKDYKGTTKLNNPGTPQGMLRDIEKFAESQGQGSRGNIVCWWKVGGGHSMIWENINGKVVFKDGQTNQVYDNFAEQVLKHANPRMPVEMLRTDNLTINTSTAKNFLNTSTLTKTYIDNGAEITARFANNPVVQLGATATASAVVYKVSTRRAVESYRNENPNTTLTDKEIIDMLKYQY